MFRLNRTRIIILAVVLLAVGGGVRYGCVRYKAKKTPPKTERIPRTMEETLDRLFAEAPVNAEEGEEGS